MRIWFKKKVVVLNVFHEHSFSPIFILGLRNVCFLF